MSNNSYLYTLDNQPKSYSDRPNRVNSISEWPYFVPFTYRALLSGNTWLCSSLIADGYEDQDDEDENTNDENYAISAEFSIGYERLKKFKNILEIICEDTDLQIAEDLDEFLSFVISFQEKYFLLETVELDMMTSELGFKESVLAEVEKCKAVGVAIDMLSEDINKAAEQLKLACTNKQQGVFEAFYGLQLNENYDSTREGKTDYPLGLYCDVSISYEIQNKEEFDKNN